MCSIKKLTLIICLIAIVFTCVPVYAAAPPEISADSAVLVDIRTGQILYEKNAHEKRPPASTTKILTALLALEGGELSEIVTVSSKASSIGESSIYLQAGEKLTLEELVYGALIKSGNDACVAIAEHIAGTEDNFVRLMNLKAHLLGAMDSHFVNTNGLPDDKHFSSAYDLAVIARHALHNPVFRRIVSTREKVINGPGWKRYLRNTNKLLGTYAWADGVKTGTTNAAGQCLVASATRKNQRIVCVVLHSSDRYHDSTAILNYGFNNFKYVEVLTEGQYFSKIRVNDGVISEVQVAAKDNLGAVIPIEHPEKIEKKVILDKELNAPVRKGQKVGKVELFLDGVSVGSTDLMTCKEIPRLPDYKILWRNFMEK